MSKHKALPVVDMKYFERSPCREEQEEEEEEEDAETFLLKIDCSPRFLEWRTTKTDLCCHVNELLASGAHDQRGCWGSRGGGNVCYNNIDAT